MKIFVLLSRIPWPLEKGDKLRAFHQIKELASTHEIVLCALNSKATTDKEAAFRALQPYCVSINFIDLPFTGIMFNVFKAWISGKPLQTGYFYNKRAASKTEKLISLHKPDVLYGQLLRVAEYIRYSKLPKALDYQDVFSKGVQRRKEIAAFFLKPFFHMEYKRLLRYEASIFDDFDVKTIISIPDRDLIPHPDNQQILIIPNGVDQEFFQPRDIPKRYDIVFIGNMAYPPNVDAALFLVREIMPYVWKELPQATVLIAGATPDKQVRALASDKVIISGWIDDIRDAYAAAKVFIAPMRIGTGLQNKLLEAMSMQLPSITTPLAHSALGGRIGEEILVGDTAAELADSVVHLLTDTEFAQRIARQGQDFVKQEYHWTSSTQLLIKAMSKMKDAHTK
ncbi:MAG: glycosyltransferase [Bacteroidales bacterium]|jgi:glycosyltransferase involved in cell wall biosynthesis|nr:glycosyltransferase [Bacteroidales bacterium]MDD3701166.1 glycosyltransferase [Bacteroidales bacterium]MDY0368613.1 glycosyltransferase [Bacteroidales bacterium]